MQRYTGFGTRSTTTPQTEPIPGREASMSRNNAGGFSFVIDDMTRLHRFLVLGSASNTLYVNSRELTSQNLEVVDRLIKAGRGIEVIDKIVEISHEGRAVSNDPALFALARCCASDQHPWQTYTNKKGETRKRLHPDDIAVLRHAYAAIPKVARTGTHFLHFQEYVKQFKGHGTGFNRALQRWYNEKEASRLAYQTVKYQQRDGWSQRDVLRLARPRPVDEAHNGLYHWIVKGWENADAIPSEEALGMIWAFERAKHTTDANEVADLILKYKLPREAVPNTSLNSVKVWEALLEEMPMEAMIRNLATMTKNGVLVPMGEMTKKVLLRLGDADAIHKARIHPIKVLAALMTYESGHSQRGSASWTPLREIIDALNAAFYLAFKCVEPSGKRIVLALDVSGSMGSGTINGIPGLTPRVASAAMALVTAATEPTYTIMAFSRGFVPLNISPRQRLDDAVRAVSNIPFDSTDCAQPMLWAMKNNIQADAFAILTDNETYAGYIQPAQSLQQYRQKFGIPAKLVVVGMTSTQFSIADSNDAGMLDVVGLDANTPSMISDFLANKI